MNSRPAVRTTIVSLVALALALTLTAAAALDAEIFATVDGSEITRVQFEREVFSAVRQTFYHGQPPTDAEYIELRENIANRLVDRALLLHEAKRRAIAPDHSSIAAKLAVYEDRYADSERFQVEGEQMLSRLRQRFEEDSILALLEEQVRAGIEPADESVARSYYASNAEKFTEPEKIRVSVILLAVAPSSTAEVWDAARLEAADIVQRISAGESFAELARMRSADPSGKNGGDMGYLHAGMLSDTAQNALVELEIGELPEPVTVLEGIAVFRLTGRQPAALQPFAAVHERAADLWRRDAGESLWQQMISDLRAGSSVTIDEVYLRSVTALRL